MRLSRLVLRNAMSRPVRSALLCGFTLLSVFVAGFLRSVVTTLDDAVRRSDSRRITVQSGISLFAEVPASYRDPIAAIEGVESVGRWSWFAGVYKDPKEFFPRMAVDLDVLFAQYPEIVVPEDQRRALLADRRGCLIGRELARRYGLSLGDVVPIMGTLYRRPNGEAWEFTVRAIYESTDPAIQERILFLHWAFLEETRRALPEARDMAGLVTLYMVHLKPGYDAASVCAAIDRRYDAGPMRVHAQTEAAFHAERISTLGNVTGFLGWIGGAVVLAMLFSIGNAMGITASERRREAGLLKALGFRDRVAAGTLLFEAVVVVGTGGLLGTALSVATAPLVQRLLANVLPTFRVRWETAALSAALALALGLLGGLIPAIRLWRVRPVAVLRDDG